MGILSSRGYAGDRDLQAMLELLAAVRPADRIADYPSLVDVRELMAVRHVRGNTRLWFDDGGRLAGFAYVDQYDNLGFEFHQDTLGPDVEAEVVDWSVGCRRLALRQGGGVAALDASCRGDDADRMALLERHGFVLQDIRSLHLVRPLDEPIAAPAVPAGFRLRHVAGEHEVEALVSLHRAAFGTDDMTAEERLAMMHVPDYDAEMDLLAVAPDGRLAAYCMCSIYREENERAGRNEGHTDPVATHPDFRRRRLARALLLTGLHLLKQRGMDTALLGTSSQNIAMLRAAESVGFYVQSTMLWFSRPVPPDEVAG